MQTGWAAISLRVQLFGLPGHWLDGMRRAAMWRLAAVQPLIASSGSVSILRVHTSEPIPTLAPSRVR